MFLSALLLALPAFVAAISSGETTHTNAAHTHASMHAHADAHSVLHSVHALRSTWKKSKKI
jgi:hypothetical protein